MRRSWFTNLLSQQNVSGVNIFVVSSIDLFRSRLQDMTNGGSRILINDNYILFTLLSGILKKFISKRVYSFFIPY